MLTLSPCNCKHPQTKKCHEKREALGTDFKKDVPLPQPYFVCQVTDPVSVNPGLSACEEKELSSFLKTCSDIGYGKTRRDVMSSLNL